MNAFRLLAIPAILLLLTVWSSAQDDVQFSMVPTTGRSTRASVEIKMEGKRKLATAKAKDEKFKAETRIEFVDLVEKANGAGIFEGKRRYLRWERDWNDLALDPEQAGALVAYSSDDDALHARGIEAEGDLTADCCSAEAQAVQSIGFALEYLSKVSAGKPTELDVAPLAQIMMGTGRSIAEAKGSFVLIESDGKTAKLGGKTVVKHEDRVLNEVMNWEWELDCEYHVDLTRGQFLAIVWKGDGTMKGKRGTSDLEGTGNMHAKASATPGVEVEKVLALPVTRLRTVSRFIESAGVVIQVPSDWTPVEFESLGHGFGLARETDETKSLAFAIKTTPAAGKGKNAKEALAAASAAMSEEGFKMKPCRGGLGSGITGEVESEDGIMIVDAYLVQGRIMTLYCIGGTAVAGEARALHEKVRKSLRQIEGK